MLETIVFWEGMQSFGQIGPNLTLRLLENELNVKNHQNDGHFHLELENAPKMAEKMDFLSRIFFHTILTYVT